MVYAREVEERTLTLRVSGLLWNRSLVMEDVETGSLWSHILGECMRGELEGKTLEVIPAVLTTWEDWLANQPRTTAIDLTRTSRAFDREFYQKPERFVLGLAIGGKVKAYPFDRLQSERVIEDEVGGEPVLVVFDPGSTRAAAFSRRLGSAVLAFKAHDADGEKGTLVDKGSEGRWSAMTGEAVSGPRRGERLRMLPAIISYRKAWGTFHPESAYHGERD